MTMMSSTIAMLRTIQSQRLVRSLAFQHSAGKNQLIRPRQIEQQRWKSTSKSNSGSGKVSPLTRKERRRLEREAQKKAQSGKTSAPLSETSTSGRFPFDYDSIRTRLVRWIPNPRIPGGARTLFHETHRMQLAARFSLALVILCILESEETAPYAMDMAQGPSMLPTFATIGDIYFRETGAWSRLLGIPSSYERGDLIVFRDESGGYAGKRIIGVAGDEVLRYGEYVNLYQYLPNWGISKSQRAHDFEEEENEHMERDPGRCITVPPNHVWLEGDNPPFSVDSRHYGPIPVDWVRGRILGRVWPWKGESLSKTRPQPLPVEVALAGKYNLHLNPAAAQNLRRLENEK